jgi:hypothetical protein
LVNIFFFFDYNKEIKPTPMKYSVVLIIAIMFTNVSCRVLNLESLKPEGKNAQLLPALEAQFDLYSLEKNYPDKFISQTDVSFRSGETISHDIDMLNMQSTDVSSNDLITLFERDVKYNITNPYGEKKGIIVCRIAGKDSRSNRGLLLLSSLSLCTLNMLGMPFSIEKTFIDIDVDIYNNNNELVGMFSANGKGKKASSMYGYNKESAERKANIDAFKEAMSGIKEQIEDDYSNLISKLE